MSGEILECLLAYHQEDLQKYDAWRALELLVRIQMHFAIIITELQGPQVLKVILVLQVILVLMGLLVKLALLAQQAIRAHLAIYFNPLRSVIGPLIQSPLVDLRLLHLSQDCLI